MPHVEAFFKQQLDRERETCQGLESTLWSMTTSCRASEKLSEAEEPSSTAIQNQISAPDDDQKEDALDV